MREYDGTLKHESIHMANILNENPTTDTLKDIVKEVNNHCAALDKSHDKVIHTAQTPTDVRLENAFTETVQKLRTIETQSIQLLGVSENKQTEQKVSVANERGTKSARQSSRRSRKTKSSQCELERKVTQLQSEMADQQGEIEIQQTKDQLEQKRIKDQLEQKRIKDELEHQLEQKRIKDQLEQKRIKDELEHQLEQKRIKDQLEQKRIKDELEQKRIKDQLERKEKQHKMKLIQRQLDKATEELSIKLSGSNCSLSTSGDNLEDYSAQVTARYVYNHNNGDMSAPLHNTPVTHSPVSTDDKYIGNLNPSHSSAICNINDQPAGPRILICKLMEHETVMDNIQCRYNKLLLTLYVRQIHTSGLTTMLTIFQASDHSVIRLYTVYSHHHYMHHFPHKLVQIRINSYHHSPMQTQLFHNTPVRHIHLHKVAHTSMIWQQLLNCSQIL